MSIFQRAIRFFLTLLALGAGAIVALAAYFARQMIQPPRRELWATPADAGLAYDEVEFPARDGLRLSGWFLPTGAELAPTVILVHGWPWNRLGAAADDLMANISGALPVDLLRLAHALHGEGYHVLMFDLRNHGRSASSNAVTFGLQESNDLLGALDFLQSRREVDKAAIGVAGFSMGANAILYALPHTDKIRAAVAVQPVSPGHYAKRYAADLLGVFGKPVRTIAGAIYERASGVGLTAIEPVLAAAGVENTPILYIQGIGDRWGSVSNVAHMAEMTSSAVTPLFVDSNHRFGGYREVINNPQLVTDFFRKQLSGNVPSHG